MIPTLIYQPISNFITWDVNPIIFEVFNREVRYYGLFFALAFLLGYQVMAYVYKKDGLRTLDVDRLSVFMVVAVIVGARLGQVLLYDPGYYFANPSEIIQIWKGGLASHGAAIGIIIAMFFYTRKPPVTNLMWMLDRIILSVPIGGALVRMGNLMNSEIYGHMTSLTWGFIFVRDPESGMLPRHPTQIYEALSYLVIFVILFLVYRTKQGNRVKPGSLFGLFLILLFGVRFVIEFLKVQQEPFETNILNQIGLNQGQLLSIPFVLLGIYFMLSSRNKIPKMSDGRPTPLVNSANNLSEIIDVEAQNI